MNIGDTINGYTLISELNNANSGFSKWGYVKKGTKEYFIKELINPVYPIDSSIMSHDMFEQKRRFCMDFENNYRRFYQAINNASHGNLVRIEEFFRCGSRYYLITEKVLGNAMPVTNIAKVPVKIKHILLKTVAKCFYDLHSAGIAHFDVKPANILIKITQNGNYAGKLIDFDSGFFIGEAKEESELGGDLTYLAPETFMGICGEQVEINEKSDIFALGLVFHEYYCGQLPGYNKSEYEYPYEVALDGGEFTLNTAVIPKEICDIIASMLDKDPEKRPSAADILNRLNALTGSEIVVEAKPVTPVTTVPLTPPVTPPPAQNPSDWFSAAGDL